MNQSYKSIYNEQTGAWIAVSELTRTGGKKAKSTHPLGLAVVAIAATLSSMGTAHAIDTATAGSDYTTVNSTGAIPVAAGANAIAIGQNASATSAQSVAIGDGAQISASTGAAIAIGAGASVSIPSIGTANTSIAIGNQAQSHDTQEVIIGARAGFNATPLLDAGFLTDSVMVGAQAGANSSYSYATFVGQEAGRSSNGKHNTAIGQNAMRFMQGGNNTALGSNALASANAAGLNAATGTGNTAIGSGAGSSLQGNSNAYLGTSAGTRTTGSSNVGLGVSAGSNATGTNNVASGSNAGARVKGDNNIASGFLAGYNTTGSNNIAMGYFSGLNSFVGITASDTIALGTSSLAVSDRAIAIGANAQARIADNVSLGANSVDKAAVQVTSATMNVTTATLNADGTTTYTTSPYTYGGFAGNAIGVVSVGSVGAERQIVNVAAGEISATSTDAINGSQLYAVTNGIAALSSSVTNIVNNAQTHYYSVNDGGTQGGNYNNDGATGANSVASGVGASSAGVSSVAMGHGANVAAAATGGVAIGKDASTTVAGGVAMGEGSVSSTAAGVAGYVPPTASVAQTAAIAATTSTAGAVAVGDASNGVYRQITGVAAGSADSDAVNVAQLKATVTTAVDSVALNFAGNSGDVVSVANNGTLAIKGEATTAGAYTGANMKTVTDPNTGAINIQMAENPVFTSVTTGNTTLNNNGLVINNGPSVTSAGINANNTVISNVAPGIADNDAVNVSQLKEFKGDVSNEFKSLRKEMRGGVALAAALVAVTPVEPGKSHVNLEVATHKGEYGMGVSWLKRSV